MQNKLKTIVVTSYWRTQVAVGAAMLVVSDIASANYTVDTSTSAGTSVDSLLTNLTNVPVLLMNISQIAGIWSGYMAWSNWQKAQKGNDPQATPGKTAAYIVGAVLGYFLPTVMGMGGKTLLPSL